VRLDRCEGKAATALTEMLTDCVPCFVAEEPEHCHDWCRLIRPDQTYILTTEQAVVDPDCVTVADASRLGGGLTVELGEDRLLVRCGSSDVEVLPHVLPHVPTRKASQVQPGLLRDRTRPSL
jgi:hypothetical protein